MEGINQTTQPGRDTGAVYCRYPQLDKTREIINELHSQWVLTISIYWKEGLQTERDCYSADGLYQMLVVLDTIKERLPIQQNVIRY